MSTSNRLMTARIVMGALVSGQSLTFVGSYWGNQYEFVLVRVDNGFVFDEATGHIYDPIGSGRPMTVRRAIFEVALLLR